ncbi:MAG: HEPN domain-containing protein [Candidatus Marinimicrobia bacterium]|nr:HEPN domain-containing protein [Candidatus Neomarinimicrobiota bacterium]
MMTREEGEKLIHQAEWVTPPSRGDLLSKVRIAWEKRNHNLVVRRVQEVVELALKGGVRVLGGEYPKVHDVAPVFCRLTHQKIGVPNSDLVPILRISQWLSEARAPSFYMEMDYPEEDAKRAYDDAQIVLNPVKEMLDIK